MAEPAARKATYADVEAAPPHLVAELIHGSLVTHPRIATVVGGDEVRLPPFDAASFSLGLLWPFDEPFTAPLGGKLPPQS